MTNCPNILVFHKVSPDFSFGSTNYSPKRFERLLEIIVSAGYSFVSLTDALKTNDSLCLGISFDDGYKHLIISLPALIKKYALKPVIFMPTDLIGAENSWDYSSRFKSEPHLNQEEIKQLADLGVEFGSHGASHTDLCELSGEDLKTELERSKSTLASITSQPVEYISYPFGRHDNSVTVAAARAGFKAGFTMSFPRNSDSSMAIGRKAIYGFDTPFAVLQKLGHGPLSDVERFKAALTNRLSAGNKLYQKLWIKNRRY